MRTTTRITIIAVACLAAAGLAGCSAKTNTSSTPTTTETVTTPVSPAPTDATTTPPSASSTPSTGTGTGTGTGTSVSACTSANLTASVGRDAGGGTAGSTYMTIVLTNKAATGCTLQGWPGVSFVGHGNGTQIGQAAAFDRTSTHATVTLASHGSASASLRVAEAGNYSTADCKPTTADGFRVYPPGQKASLFASMSGLTACASTSVDLLTVSAFK